jgi:hypothetical protein
MTAPGWQEQLLYHSGLNELLAVHAFDGETDDHAPS